jgi:glucose-1-phosphate cytidylyltransferase
MKVVILAGGLGTRISEESLLKPKPMIEIGGKPILWHIMKIYSQHNITEFIVCCGYKGYIIKEYFANYFLHMSDVTFNMSTNEMQIHQHYAEPWKVTLVDTGEETMTGGRLKKIKNYVGFDDFCLTYGDGVGNVDITKLINFHLKHGKHATVTAVKPAGRFGALGIEGTKVVSFTEKPNGDGSYINGGFFVLSPKIFELIDGDQIVLEREPIEKLTLNGQLEAFFHHGFWQPMDTMRDKTQLDELWSSGNAPWKVWL